LTASHGPAQSRMLDDRCSSDHRTHHMVPSSSTLKHRKRLIVCIADLSLLKLLVDVLRQYSLPNMDLRIVTCLIIALLPKHNNIRSSPFQLPHLGWPRLISSPSEQSTFFFTCVVSFVSKFIFGSMFMFCFLFFFLPLRLHGHSRSQVQTGYPIADPRPSSLASSVLQASPDHVAICKGRHVSRGLVIVLHLSL
jgi:hypothetical protein